MKWFDLKWLLLAPPRVVLTTNLGVSCKSTRAVKWVSMNSLENTASTKSGLTVGRQLSKLDWNQSLIHLMEHLKYDRSEKLGSNQVHRSKFKKFEKSEKCQIFANYDSATAIYFIKSHFFRLQWFDVCL